MDNKRFSRFKRYEINIWQCQKQKAGKINSLPAIIAINVHRIALFANRKEKAERFAVFSGTSKFRSVMYLVKTPGFLQNLFPTYTWKVPTGEKVLYLTFDDGPVPEVTPWVLDQLDEYQAKATFFCVGENVKKHGDIFERLIGSGHTAGSHTYNHLNGWGTDNITYFHNVRHGAFLVNSRLFRPPYGKMLPSQVQFLSRHYRIVMWDVLSGDFDRDITPEQCLSNVLHHAVRGSIIVFHDSIKAWNKLSFTLPKVLDHFSERGYRFESLDPLFLLKSDREQVRV